MAGCGQIGSALLKSTVEIKAFTLKFPGTELSSEFFESDSPNLLFIGEVPGCDHLPKLI